MPDARDGESWSWGDDPDELRRVIEVGGVVAVPSESSYGLALAGGVPAAAGGVTLAIRVPAHEALRGLLRTVDSVFSGLLPGGPPSTRWRATNPRTTSPGPAHPAPSARRAPDPEERNDFR